MQQSEKEISKSRQERATLEKDDEKLPRMNLELAVGLSQVFEALKRIAGGDVELQIDETSEVELIAKLKQLVNQTATNMAEVVDLCHEFAIGLAEHFHVLHKVSKGDLQARVKGTSKVELLVHLRELTNQMIDNITDAMRARDEAMQALKQREAEVEFKAGQLDEVNRALGVLLRQREDERKRIEERIIRNINELVLPYLEKVKRGRLDGKPMTYLRILESNLQDIVTPFVHRLSLRYGSLTPTEIQIGHLIRDGRTTKEIAELLNVSQRTVDCYRSKIRAKLGIKNKKANLRTHLLSM